MRVVMGVNGCGLAERERDRQRQRQRQIDRNSDSLCIHGQVWKGKKVGWKPVSLPSYLFCLTFTPSLSVCLSCNPERTTPQLNRKTASIFFLKFF